MSTVRHHVALRLLRHFEVPDGDTSVGVTAHELLALVMPTYRTQRLRVYTLIYTTVYICHTFRCEILALFAKRPNPFPASNTHTQSFRPNGLFSGLPG